MKVSIWRVRKCIYRIPAGVLLTMAVFAAVGSPAAAQGRYPPYAYATAPFSVRVPPPTLPVAPPPVIYVLPGGCAPVRVGAVIMNNCAGVWYRPYYYGPNIVYSQVPPPY